MQVHVCAKSQVHRTIKRHNATHLVSILDPGEHLFITERINSIPRIHLYFEDVLVETTEGYGNYPKKEHIQRVLDFTKDLLDDSIVVVHCFAGVSRSTAAALAILTQHHLNQGFGGEGSIKMAVRQLLEVRPQARPNTLIAKYSDDILGLNGMLFEASEKIRGKLITLNKKEE
jgi:predicted protein tyrosine phosphatase